MATVSKQDLAWLLDGLGLDGGHIVVHTALSSFDSLEGGAASLCAALIEAVGDQGTIVMPTFTATETLSAAEPPVAFHADMPVSRELGVVPEFFRRLPGVLRSSHPTHSFAVWGRRARDVLSTQRDNNIYGPLKKLNVAQGHVMLLGTTLRSAAVLHLAEEQAGMPYLQRRTAWRINSAGYDERVVIEGVPGCSLGFDRLEEKLDPEEVVAVQLPRGWARKIAVRYLMRLAMSTLQRDRAAFVCGRADCASCAEKLKAVGRGQRRTA